MPRIVCPEKPCARCKVAERTVDCYCHPCSNAMCIENKRKREGDWLCEHCGERPKANGPGGPYCRECKPIVKIQKVEGDTTKKCTKCGDTKTFDLFGPHSSNWDGLQSWCKECRSKANKELKEQRKQPRHCRGCDEVLVGAKPSQKYCSTDCKKNTYIPPQPKEKLCAGCGRVPRFKTSSLCKRCRQAARHGLTYDDWENLLRCQFYRCPVCLDELYDNDETLVIDHDHECCDNDKGLSCGRCARGILHDTCNRDIGRFNDDPIILRRAADYLDPNWQPPQGRLERCM